MTIHRTNSGHIELLDQWGHGRGPKGSWRRRPATIVVDDGDGHYTAWAFSGDIKDAAAVAARFDLRNDGRYVAVLSGNSISMEAPPEGFWRELPDGSIEPDVEAHPEVVAY